MLTKEKEFKFLTDDLTFKKVFSNSDVLRDFIYAFYEYLNINKDIKFQSILSEKYLEGNNKNVKAFYSDIVGTLDNGNIIFLEMYSTNFNKRLFNKSLSYLCRIYSSQINKGCYKYENNEKVIGINLINNKYDLNEKIINEYTFMNRLITKSYLTSDIVMYNIRLDKVKDIVYTSSSKRFIKWLKLISAKSIEELEEIGKDDKIMQNSIRVLKEWNNMRDVDAMERYYGEKMLEKEELGIKKEQVHIAKNMLNLNIPLAKISLATGLSIKELKTLKN